MRVRPAARLDVADVAWVVDVADVEDPEPAQSCRAHGVVHSLRAAVHACVEILTGNEEQVAIHGDVTLRAGTDVRRSQFRIRRVRDVPDLPSVIVALNN